MINMRNLFKLIEEGFEEYAKYCMRLNGCYYNED
mgnify:CR=1 FL=1